MTYDVVSDSFALSVSHSTVSFSDTFGATDKIDGSSDATFTVYAKSAGEKAFVLLKPNDPTLGLSYVTLGNWTSLDSDASSVANGYLVFGIRAPLDSVPTTGSATYNGQTVGTLVDASGVIYSIAGGGVLTANFGAGTVAGNFTGMAKIDLLTNAATPWRDFTTASTIGGNQFGGTAATKDGKLTGTNEGGFYGPGAAEIGGVYRLTGSGEQAVGAFVGKK